jgi:hypothetical protein
MDLLNALGTGLSADTRDRSRRSPRALRGLSSLLACHSTLAAPVPSRLPTPTAPVQSGARRDGIAGIYGIPALWNPQLTESKGGARVRIPLSPPVPPTSPQTAIAGAPRSSDFQRMLGCMMPLETVRSHTPSVRVRVAVSEQFESQTLAALRPGVPWDGQLANPREPITVWPPERPAVPRCQLQRPTNC